MATWEDGPEYAPAERPDLFAPPEQVPPLEATAPPPKPSAGAPLQPPAGFQGPQQAVPLESLVPRVGESRDPHRAFEVAGSAMTEQSSTAAAWGAAHSSSWASQWAPPQGAPVVAAPPPTLVHDPAQPFVPTQGMRPGMAPVPPPPGTALPPPGTDQWFAPTSWAPPRVAADDRSLLRKVVDGTSAPLLIVLVIGLVPMLSPFAVLGALGLTALARRRRHQLRASLLVGAGVLVLAGLMGLLTTGSITGALELMQSPAVLVCLVMLVLAPVQSYLSIQAGEPELAPEGSTRGSSSWG